MIGSLEGALNRLLAVLTRLEVPASAALQSGLSAEAIERFARGLKPDFPPELTKLYQWRNGTRESTRAYQLYPGGIFLRLQDAAQLYQQLMLSVRRAIEGTPTRPEEIYDERWFPVFIDAAGRTDVVVCGTATGAGSVWHVLIEDASERRQLAGGLEEFIEIIGRRWEEGTYYYDRELGSPMVDHRLVAAERRAQSRPSVDVLRLVNDLEANDAQARATALRTLKEFLFPEAVPSLARLLTHPRSEVRNDAASLLGQIGEPAAKPALEAALGDGDPSVRATVEWALQELRAQGGRHG